MSKVSFIVVDEHTLGCTYTDWPNRFQILGTSVLKGSPFDPRVDGWTFIPPNAKLRPAKRADFATFRVSSEGYEKDTERYNFPTE